MTKKMKITKKRFENHQQKVEGIKTQQKKIVLNPPTHGRISNSPF